MAIAVVGIGAVFPGAPDAPTFWRNIERGVDAIRDVPAGRWDPAVYYDEGAYDHPEPDRFYCRRGGFVDDLATFDPLAFGIMPTAVAGTEPDQLLALRACAEAIADAGGDAHLGDRTRVGVILGRGGYIGPATARLDSQVRAGAQLMVTLAELLPELAPERLAAVRRAFHEALAGPAGEHGGAEQAIGLVPNLAASRVANRFDLHGPAYTVDAACASGLIAIDQASQELASGRCDAVLAGAVHHCHDVTLWSVFSQLRALSRNQEIRPFDRRADGTLVAEGTGMLLLKRLADAQRDGDRVYAVIRGLGTSSDGRATSLMSPSPDGQVLAIARAWESAGLDPTRPGIAGLLEGHGTGTPAGDASELTAIERVFGPPDGFESGVAPVLGTVKSMIGHAMPAAGIAGLIKAVLAVHHGVLPPTLHAEEPHPALAATRFRLISRAEPWPENIARRAGVNAFGFGGINAHVVLEAAPAPKATRGPTIRRRPEGSSAGRTLLLTGATPAELLAALDGDPTSGANGPCRLAIVDPTPQRLELARKVIRRGSPWRGRNDVWFTAAPLLGDSVDPGLETAGSGIAFLFPGFEPHPDGPADDVADHFGLERPMLSGSQDLVGRGVDIGAIGSLLADALTHLGILPQALAGHSLGEWTAMMVAGMMGQGSAQMLAELFQDRRGSLPDVAYATLGCPAEQATAGIAAIDGVVLSHDNCPHQVVVCGHPEQIDLALQRFRRRGVLGEVVPYRSGFHSPMMRGFVDAAADTFGRLEVAPARWPVWSATSAQPYPRDPAAIRELVVAHLVEPVRFRELVERLYATGIRAFVQVGSGSLLSFVDDTLSGRNHLTVAARSGAHGGLDDLRRVVAALWVEGASPALDRMPGEVIMRRKAEQAGTRLDLGAPLVRLGAAVAPLTTASPRPPAAVEAASATPGGGGPEDAVLAAYQSTLAELEASAQAVTAAWSMAGPTGSASTPPQDQPGNGSASGTAAAGMASGTLEAIESPAMAPVQQGAAPAAPADILRVERTFSLAAMPHLADHGLFPQAPGWPEVTDTFPIVPMTGLLEVMADAARQRFPDRIVCGFQSVRAMRWLAVAPPTVVAVEVHEAVGDQVRVVIPGYAEGLVRLGLGFPAPPPPAGWALTGVREPWVDAATLYAEGWMFHGPAYAGVVEITAAGDNGLHGVIESLPAPGALLDAAGQLAGHWCQAATQLNRMVFPTSIAAVSLFGPPPAPGERLGVDVAVRGLYDTAFVADIEVRDAAGRVWARIDGWTTRRLVTDDVVWNALQVRPSTATLSEPQPGGWCLVRQRWDDRAAQEFTMRRYLGAAERDEYAARTPHRQPAWLLGRIAAKDAARHWLWQQGHGPLFPAEIRVGNDVLGRPWIRTPGPPLNVSLAHAGGLAAAIVCPAGRGRIGIDVEAVASAAAASDAVAALALGPGERELCEQRLESSDEPRAVWLARFWTAKEAVAKAEGTGLAGRPQDFEVVEAGAEHVTVCVRGDRRWAVATRLVHGAGGGRIGRVPSHVASWTLGPTEGGLRTIDLEPGASRTL